MGRSPKNLYVESEKYNVAVFHYVFLAFGTYQTLFFCCVVGTQTHQVVIVYYFGTDETSIVEMAEDGDELAQLMEAETEEKETWLQTIFGKVKDSAEEKLEKAKEVLVRYTEQTAVMLVTSCAIPVVVLLFLFWVCKTVIGLDIALPKRKTLRIIRRKK